MLGQGGMDGLSDQPTRLLEFHMLYGTNNSLAWLWYKVDEKWSNKQNRPRRPSPTRPLLIAGADFSVLQSNKISQSLARQSDNQSRTVTVFIFCHCELFSQKN